MKIGFVIGKACRRLHGAAATSQQVTTLTMTCRCEEETQSDYVSVTSDDHVTSASGRRMCGANAQYAAVRQFRSNSSSLYVRFRSNQVFDATGFEATYQFHSPVQGRTSEDLGSSLHASRSSMRSESASVNQSPLHQWWIFLSSSCLRS